jgi:hypothetical protein
VAMARRSATCSASTRVGVGSARSTRSDIQVARPSLSHRSRQSAGVTRPPNHAWASSWAITSATSARASASLGPTAMSAAMVINPGFSIAPFMSGTTIRSSLGYGNGRSIHACEAAISGPTSARACSTCASATGAITRAGTGAPGTSATAKSPTANATR